LHWLFPQVSRYLYGDAAAGNGRDLSLRGVLYDPGGRQPHDVAHARCPQIFVVGISSSSAERKNGTRTLRGRADALSSLFSSSLSLATVLVIVLNLLFPYWHSEEWLAIGPQADSTENFCLYAGPGATWGARKEVIDRVTYAMSEFIEAVGTLELAEEQNQR